MSGEFIPIFTRAHTPVLRDLYYGNLYYRFDSDEICNLIQSKNSLRSFDIKVFHAKFTMVMQIIDVFKCGDRPFLQLNIWPRIYISEAQVIKRVLAVI